MRSLLPHTKPLHRNAPIRRGLKAASLHSEGRHGHRAAPSPLRGEGWGEGRVLATALPTSVGARQCATATLRLTSSCTIVTVAN